MVLPALAGKIPVVKVEVAEAGRRFRRGVEQYTSFDIFCEQLRDPLRSAYQNITKGCAIKHITGAVLLIGSRTLGWRSCAETQCHSAHPDDRSKTFPGSLHSYLNDIFTCISCTMCEIPLAIAFSRHRTRSSSFLTTTFCEQGLTAAHVTAMGGYQ